MWAHLKDKSIILPAITAEEISKQVEPVLREMEKVGIKLDIDELKRFEGDIEEKANDLHNRILKIADCEINIDSPIQLADLLFKKFKLPTEGLKKTKTGISTAAGELGKIADKHEIIKLILEYRELKKLLTTYLKPLPLLVDEDGRLHTHYGQDTSTGRLNSFEPNLQNIPIKGKWGPKIRGCFVAQDGYKLISADYSQIELRVVACLAEDKEMMEAFNSGKDIHAETAADVFDIPLAEVSKEQRRFAKTINFGVLYGMSPYGLSQALNIPQNDAALYIAKYFDVYRGIKDYVNRMIDKAKTDGYVETLFGAKRELPNINSNYRVAVDADERIAINSPVQGTAAEILKLAMIRLADQLQVLGEKRKAKSEKPIARLLLTVHDELVVEAPEEDAEEISKLVKETMENVVKLCVPIEVEVGVGKNWAEAK